jgi:chromosomal replication initiator protein
MKGLADIPGDRFTFENFVVGESNELAYVAARRSAECAIACEPSSPFNPLLFFGGAGVGKTHLMRAIAAEIARAAPERRVIYLSAEQFMFEFIRALRMKDTRAFNKRFRSLDVLMIDDIQLIAGKEATQQEFYNTLNALIADNRQVVIAGDESPFRTRNIEEGVRARLCGGLAVELRPPTYELRLAILQSKTRRAGIDIANEVLDIIAKKFRGNVRELEGALNRVVAETQLLNRAITVSSAEDVLNEFSRASTRRFSA